MSQSLRPGSAHVVLGTVQLGLPYGRRRQRGLMSEEQAFGILDAAWDIGIRSFDTAESYGESAGRLRRWLGVRGRLAGARVVTKVTTREADDPRAVSRAAERFRDVRELVVLTHGAIAGVRWTRFRDKVRSMGASAGQSVYEAEEVASAASGGADRIQAPANVLDAESLAGRGERSVPMDLRSAYLQGLLLEQPEIADERVPGSAPLVGVVRRAAAGLGSPLGVLLLGAVFLQLRGGDRVVVGVDDAAQVEPLRLLAEAPVEELLEFVRRVRSEMPQRASASITDPRRWT